MTFRLCSPLLLLLLPTLLQAQPAATNAPPSVDAAMPDGITWHDPRSAPFRLVGFPWIEQDQVYRRLPLQPDWPIPRSVNGLANSTAGGQLQFQTDSAKILLRVKLPRKSGMYHMAATGQSGFDLYTGKPGALRYYATTRFGHGAATYEATLLSGAKTNRNIVLNFPLYNGVEPVELGLLDGASLVAPPAFASEGRIVVYGTSITQGGCAARPGMAYSNILGRRLNIAFVNLGFSGSGKGEPALAKLINQITNKKMIILDYQANAGNSIRNTLEPFIDIVRAKHPQTPILVISKITYAREIAARQTNPSALARFQRDLVERKREAGDQHLHFLDGSTLLGDHADECTVDGVHPTDLGFMRMANGIEPVLRQILDLPK